MHLVCPFCEAVNRVPEARISEKPDCGVCHKSLLTTDPVELSAERFDKFTGRTELPVVVDFWAEWCGPCKMMAPQFARAASELAGKVQFAKVETDRQPSLSQRFAIRSIPTLMLFKNGREVDRVAGAMSKNDLIVWLNLPRA